MTALSDLSCSLLQLDQRSLLGRGVQQPAPATTHSIYAITLTGWTVGRNGPIERVDLFVDGKVVESAEPTMARRDVAERFPETAWALESGWQMTVDCRAFDMAFAGHLRAVVGDGTTVPIAVIRGQRQPFPAASPRYLQPFIITALARSGTTWLMHLLGEHPEIVAFRRYPYEMRPALYWIHMFRVLSGTYDQSNPAFHRRRFQSEQFAVSANPFQGKILADYPHLHAWSEPSYIENLATFCHDSIESWYRNLALDQGRPDAVCFAEKHHSYFEEYHPSLLRELYPGMREVFLVRDFRDVLSSGLAFHARAVGQDPDRWQEAIDETLLVAQRNEAAKLVDIWRRRSAHAHLIRYEDLIRQPAETLRSLLAYAGLDSSPATIAGVLERARTQSSKQRQHLTSPSPEASIGRWRRDLDPALQAIATDLFRDLLAQVGYDDSWNEGGHFSPGRD